MRRKGSRQEARRRKQNSAQGKTSLRWMALTGWPTILQYAHENEIRAAAMAAPLVAKYGQLIAVHFDAQGHPYAVNVGIDGGKKFRIDMTKAPAEGGSSVIRYGTRTNLPKADASEERVTQSAEKSKSKKSERETVRYSTKITPKQDADYAAPWSVVICRPHNAWWTRRRRRTWSA